MAASISRSIRRPAISIVPLGAASTATPNQRRFKKTAASSSASSKPSTKAPPAPTLSPSTISALSSIRPSDLTRSRYSTHYHDTLTSDLLYLTYDHLYSTTPPPAPILPQWDPTNPYTINRPLPKPRGNLSLRPQRGDVTPETLVHLEQIVLSAHIKEAGANKALLLGPLMAFQAITGLPDINIPNIDIPNKDSGVSVVRTRPPSATFRLRTEQPIGVKAVLRGPAMFTFLESLIEFVFPRLKDWRGVELRRPTGGRRANDNGTVEFGLPDRALQLFPQVEVNYAEYPTNFGFGIQCVTNAKGQGARMKARALVSGLGVPFVVPEK